MTDNKYTIARKNYWAKIDPVARKEKAKIMAHKKWENLNMDERTKHSYKMIEGKRKALDNYYKSME